jgi:hypothetical protein
MIDDQPPGGGTRRVIHATCTRHRGTPGFANLVVRKLNGQIELDPHVDRGCVILLDETSARVLAKALTDWLG